MCSALTFESAEGDFHLGVLGYVFVNPQVLQTPFKGPLDLPPSHGGNSIRWAPVSTHEFRSGVPRTMVGRALDRADLAVAQGAPFGVATFGTSARDSPMASRPSTTPRWRTTTTARPPSPPRDRSPSRRTAPRSAGAISPYAKSRVTKPIVSWPRTARLASSRSSTARTSRVGPVRSRTTRSSTAPSAARQAKAARPTTTRT